MGEAVAEPLDGAHREAEGGHVPALEAADPVVASALGLQTGGLGHDPHEALAADERVGAVEVDQTRVVTLDGLRDAAQGLEAAVGLAAVPLPRGEGDARQAERVVLAGEGLTLVGEQLVQLLQGPGPALSRAQPLTREAQGVLRLAARIGHLPLQPTLAGRLVHQPLEAGLGAQAHGDPRGLDHEAVVALDPRAVPETLERPHGLHPVVLRTEAQPRVDVLGGPSLEQARLGLGQLEREPARPPGHDLVVRIAATTGLGGDAHELLEGGGPRLHDRRDALVRGGEALGLSLEAVRAPLGREGLCEALGPQGALVPLSSDAQPIRQERRIEGPELEGRLEVPSGLLQSPILASRTPGLDPRARGVRSRGRGGVVLGCGEGQQEGERGEHRPPSLAAAHDRRAPDSQRPAGVLESRHALDPPPDSLPPSRLLRGPSRDLRGPGPRRRRRPGRPRGDGQRAGRGRRGLPGRGARLGRCARAAARGAPGPARRPRRSRRPEHGDVRARRPGVPRPLPGWRPHRGGVPRAHAPVAQLRRALPRRDRVRQGRGHPRPRGQRQARPRLARLP